MEGMNYAAYNRQPESSTPPSSRPPQITTGCPYLQEQQHMTFGSLHNPHAASNYTPPRNIYDPVHNSGASWTSAAPPPYHPAWSTLPLPNGRQAVGDLNFGPPNQAIPSPQRPYPMGPAPYGSFTRDWPQSYPAFTPRSRASHPPQPTSFGSPSPLPLSNNQAREDTSQVTSMNSAHLPATSWTDSSSAPPAAVSAIRSTASPHADSGSGSPDDSDSSESSSAGRMHSPPIANGSNPGMETSLSHNGPVTPEALPQSRGTQTSGQPGFSNPPPTGPSRDRRPATEFRGLRGARFSMSRLHGDVADEALRSSLEAQQRFFDGFYPSDAAAGLRGVELTEDRIRQHQLARGGLTARQIASPSAIASLESVDIVSLDENERTCIICYNDFGTATPEGVNEAPLRLPKCKHVFGDHCIKKWFEESDSCPYCRHKLPSIQVFRPNKSSSGHAVVTQHELLNRIMSTGRRDDRDDMALAEARLHHNGRRSPPDELGNSRRRLHARHSSFRGSPPLPAMGVRPNSFAGASAASTASSTQHSPGRDRHGPYHAQSMAWLPPFHGQLGAQRRLAAYGQTNPSSRNVESYGERPSMPTMPTNYFHNYSLPGDMGRPGPVPPMMATQSHERASVPPALPPVIPPLNIGQQQPQGNLMMHNSSSRQSQPSSFHQPANYPTSMMRSTVAPMAGQEFVLNDNLAPVPQAVPGGHNWQM